MEGQWIHVYVWPSPLAVHLKLSQQLMSYVKVSVTQLFLRFFNGPEPGGPESTDKKVKERERGWYSLVTQKANKAPARGLLCSRRPQAPSRWGEGAERLLERVLEAWAEKWTQRASELLEKRERETERESKTRGPKLWWSKGVLINMVWAFILSYKVVILSKDKD